MTEYHEMVKEAAQARIGADRMAMGLSIIPDPLRGDMAEVERLRAERLAFATESEERRERIDTLIAEREAERKTLTDATADLIADNKRLCAEIEWLQEVVAAAVPKP